MGYFLILGLLLLCHIAVIIDVAFIVVNIGALLSFGLSLISNRARGFWKQVGLFIRPTW